MARITQKDINFIGKNWDKINDSFKESLTPGRYSKNLKGLQKDEHIVILLLDRQKPSLTPCYDFDEERIGVTRTGKIVWGFDSGCSCPTPWDDSYPECYNVTKTWKEFVINDVKDFDKNWEEEISERIQEIKDSLNGNKTSEDSNGV